MHKKDYEYFFAYFKKKHDVFEICEDTQEYQLKKLNNMHDKLFRDLLGDKRDLANFLNCHLNLSITEEQLEKYNSSFITKKYENREADIVYKLKGQKVYILIEHQSRRDNTMPFRMLSYNYEIIRDTNNLNEYQKMEYKYAKVIPIVIYTGGGKWNVSKKFSSLQEDFEDKNYLELKYNVIDINDYSKNELLEGGTMIEKAMLMEKARGEEELTEIIEEILGIINYDDKKQVEKMEQMIKYALIKRLGEKRIKEILNEIKYESMKEGVSMLHETLAEERLKMQKEATDKGMKEGMKEGMKKGMKKGKIEGRKEGKIEDRKNIIQKMLQFGEIEDKIQLYTGATKKQIEEIRKELETKPA